MAPEVNALNQPVGFAVDNWTEPRRPPNEVIEGRTCRLEPLDAARHGESLHRANLLDREGRNWTYLPYGPFERLDDYLAWVRSVEGKPDPQFFTIVATGLQGSDLQSAGSDLVSRSDPVATVRDVAVGVASYLRIDPPQGSIEVGHINYSPLLQRTVAATEAMYLMMRRAFELGYRRYEWKCHSLNAPSRAAAQRLGFSYEGIFRQARVDKGRNRDTAWYAMIDQEWPAIDRAFQQWLDPANFDGDGRQRTPLSKLTGPILVNRG
jgi:RimJ/RimL family protein N-acetyltransferase